MKACNLLTICVCLRNAQAHIDRCLSSVFDEIKGDPVRVLVVQHKPMAVQTRILQSWVTRHPSWLTVHDFHGEGISSARNMAWKLADTPWIAFIDIDCKVLPGWFAAVLAILLNNSDSRTGAFGGQNRTPLMNDSFYTCLNLLLPTFVGGHTSTLNRRFTTSRRVTHLPTLNVVYNTQALSNIGGFDPHFTKVAEDLDLSHRLLEHGFSLTYHPEMQVEHLYRNSLISWLNAMFCYGKGRCDFMFKNGLSASPLLIFPLLVVLGYIGGILFAAFGWFSWRTPLLLPSLHLALVSLGLLPRAIRLRTSISTFIRSTMITILTHLFYGFGILSNTVSILRTLR